MSTETISASTPVLPDGLPADRRTWAAAAIFTALAMSSLTDRVDREQVVDFVDYLNVGIGLLVAAGNPKKIDTLDDLCGRTLAVEVGTPVNRSPCPGCRPCPCPITRFPSSAMAWTPMR